MLNLAKCLGRTKYFKVSRLTQKKPCYRFSIKNSKQELRDILKQEYEEETQQEREASDFTEKFL